MKSNAILVARDIALARLTSGHVHFGHVSTGAALDLVSPLPADLEEAAMEPVPECQSPLFLHVDAEDRARVRLYFSAPAEAPTTRGFAQ